MSENIKTLAALKADISLTAGENTPSDLRTWLENLYPGDDMTTEFGFAVTIDGKGYQIANCSFDDTTEDPSGDGYDSGDGYEIGSIVVNQTLNNGDGKVWLCVDSTLGSSVWVDITNQNRYDPDAVHVNGVGEFTDITSGALDLPADGILIYEDPNNSYEKRTIEISDLFINAGEGMNTSTYDPTGVEADAFDMDNMVEGNTNKIFTAGEESKLAGIESEADKTDDVNVALAGAVMNSDTTSDMSEDLVGKLALQPAIRAYVQSVLGSGINGDIADNDNIEGDTVEEALLAIISDIETINTRISSNNSDITSLDENITSLQSAINSIESQLELIYESIAGDDDISVNGVTMIGSNTGTSGSLSLGATWTPIEGELLYQKREGAKVTVAFKATGGSNGDEVRVGIYIDGSLHTQKMKSLTTTEGKYTVELFLTSVIGIHEYDITFTPISGTATINKVYVEIE